MYSISILETAPKSPSTLVIQSGRTLRQVLGHTLRRRDRQSVRWNEIQPRRLSSDKQLIKRLGHHVSLSIRFTEEPRVPICEEAISWLSASAKSSPSPSPHLLQLTKSLPPPLPPFQPPCHSGSRLGPFAFSTIIRGLSSSCLPKRTTELHLHVVLGVSSLRMNPRKLFIFPSFSRKTA